MDRRLRVVIERNGQSREVSGWRKWALAIPVIVFAALAFAVAVVFMLGLTLTIAAILIVAVPTALILALIARSLVQREASSGWRRGLKSCWAKKPDRLPLASGAPHSGGPRRG